MTLRLPKPLTKARFLLIGYGLILLVWMSLEDSTTLSVALLGTGASIIYSGAWIANRFGEHELSLKSVSIGLILWGVLLGALSTLMIALLMFFKTSWHGHVYPDYPLAMIVDMLALMPVWAICGGLLGLSSAIFLFLYYANLGEGQGHA